MNNFIRILSSRRPQTEAHIKGSSAYPQLRGRVSFYSVTGGSIVTVEAEGLPEEQPFMAVHIHDGGMCSGNNEDAFADAGQHLNFMLLEHPLHTGDFPTILNAGGYAWGAFFTDRFTPCQVNGYAVVIHLHPDDYHTQPSGASGEKIGCGVIMPVRHQ